MDHFASHDALPMSDNRTLSDTTGAQLPCTNLHQAAHGDDLVAEYLQASRADNTRRSYESDIRDFQSWGGHVPSSADEIARYIAERAQSLKPSTLHRRLAALAALHRDQALADPTKNPLVRRVMQGIERRHGMSQKQARPLLLDDLAAIVAQLGTSPSDLRDRALLLVGFFGALRRSEVVALDFDDLRETPAGLVITIRKSKTDQNSLGRQIALSSRADQLCPMSAMTAWLTVANLSSGAVFRNVTRCHATLGERLCDKTVARIIKKRAFTAGLASEGLSGHSLRAGFVTSAALAGFNSALIARQTGHKSLQVLAAYVRPEPQPLILR